MPDDGVFNETIHSPLRLRICGLLRSVEELDFAVLRDALSVSDATLSKHLKSLSDAGFVNVKKLASNARDDSRRITWLRLTTAGRQAFDDHIRAVRAIAAGFDQLDAPN
jgi:DNA-binding MarR family transcriptional regulator